MFKFYVLKRLPLGDCAGLSGSTNTDTGRLGFLARTLFKDRDSLELFSQWAGAGAQVQQGAGTTGNSRALLSLCTG